MSLPLPAPSAAIFDLDGTLVDSLRDIAESMNASMALLGLDPLPLDNYRWLVGEGLPNLAQNAIGGQKPHLVERLVELGRAYYRTRLLTHTRPYAGVDELVRRLRARRIKLAVLSNKPHDMTVRIVRALWPDGVFDVIRGQTREAPRKPDPMSTLQVCRQLGVPPADCWFIGDTHVDVETARAARALPIGISWGFRPRSELEAAGAALVVDRPDELG